MLAVRTPSDLRHAPFHAASATVEPNTTSANAIITTHTAVSAAQT